MLQFLTKTKRDEYKKLRKELFQLQLGANDGRKQFIEERLNALRDEAKAAAEHVNSTRAPKAPVYDPADQTTWDQDLLRLAKLAGLV